MEPPEPKVVSSHAALKRGVGVGDGEDRQTGNFPFSLPCSSPPINSRFLIVFGFSQWTELHFDLHFLQLYKSFCVSWIPIFPFLVIDLTYYTVGFVLFKNYNEIDLTFKQQCYTWHGSHQEIVLGLEKLLSGCEHWMFFLKTWYQLLAPK